MENKVLKFFDDKELKVFKEYFILRHRFKSDVLSDRDIKQLPSNSWEYGDYLSETLLANEKEKIEKTINKKILPTYSAYRVYTYGEDLEEHTDRPECEISVSIHIGSSGEKWPFIVESNVYDLNPGEGVIYNGPKQKHKRDVFYGDYYIQLLLHYVDMNNEYANRYFDGRKALGCHPLEVR